MFPILEISLLAVSPLFLCRTGFTVMVLTLLEENRKAFIFLLASPKQGPVSGVFQFQFKLFGQIG